MRILVINCGSSSLKSQIMDFSELKEWRKLAEISIDKIGDEGVMKIDLEGARFESPLHAVDHSEAATHLLKWLETSNTPGYNTIDAVGHRIVHGGINFMQSTVIDEKVLVGIELVSQFAPLHNAPSLRVIKTLKPLLGPSVPMVAVFDTAFHANMPKCASEYAIPHTLASKHNIRRYGFHGIAHQYMTERYAQLTSQVIDEVNIITLQLGNGCSATAVRNGRSMDTSMGLTPLEGLVMGTRSGNVDPTLAGFLAKCEGVSLNEVENWLNGQSGLLGVSGYSKDMRELLKAESSGDPRAALAIEMFCYCVRKYIGAYMAALGGANAVVFGGGIGENSPEIRARICEGMEWCGLKLNSELNHAALGIEACISEDNSGVGVYVTPVDEETIIAKETAALLQ